MTKADLLTSFRSCKRYKQAPRWQKPWLNPGRFIRNQLNKHHIQTYRLAELRKINAFHMPQFTIVSGEGVGEQIASYGIYEESLTEAFLRLVRPGQSVVDVGMHLGYYTTLFAVLVVELGQIHAFEPTPSTRAVASHNVEGFDCVTVHPYAVWSSTCSIDFCDYGPQWMAFNSFTNPKVSVEPPVPTKIQVETTTLDQFRDTFGGKVDLVKIDAESAEREILLGAGRHIEVDKPIITVEMGDMDGKHCSRELVDLLAALDYKPWEIVSDRFRLHQPLVEYGYDNLIFAPAYRDLSAI
jgi:FkbM family methyltransferase